MSDNFAGKVGHPASPAGLHDAFLGAARTAGGEGGESPFSPQQGASMVEQPGYASPGPSGPVSVPPVYFSQEATRAGTFQPPPFGTGGVFFQDQQNLTRGGV